MAMDSETKEIRERDEREEREGGRRGTALLAWTNSKRLAFSIC